MTPNQKEEYERVAREAVTKAGLELVTIEPEDDYIEIRCPECNRVSIFHFNELNSIRCEKCYGKRCAEEFYQCSRELVEAAGFSLREANFEEDYIEVECPQCEGITSFHFDELGSIYCKDCAMEDAAFENGCNLYLGDESDGRDWEEKVDRWIAKHDARPAVLVCRACGAVHIINADTPDAVERIKKYNCKCRGVTHQLKQIASDRGFSIEFKNSPYGTYTLNANECALLCNHCGEVVVINLSDNDIEKKIADLTCPSDDCSLEEDLVSWTIQGKMAWCKDLLKVISIFDMHNFNRVTFDRKHYWNIPQEGNKEIFFAVDPTNLKYAFAYVIHADAKDEWLSKYLLFRFQIESWGTSGQSVEMLGRWPYYYRKLHKVICQDVEDGSKRVLKVAEKNFDSYISAYNSLLERNKYAWALGRTLSVLKDINNILDRLTNHSDKVLLTQDQHLQRFISLHTCPVCKKAYTSTERKCLNCGFPDLNRVFVNQQEAEYWKENIVIPYKRQYEHRNAH